MEKRVTSNDVPDAIMQQAYKEIEEALNEAHWQWDKPMREGTGSGLDGRTSSLGFNPYIEFRNKRNAIFEKYNITSKEFSEYCKKIENR